MTKQHIATAATLLACAATSQTNAFVFYPQDPERQTVTCTSYVGRPYGNAQAEAMMEVSTDHFRGVGEANGPIKLFGVYHWIADENLSTSETYDLVGLAARYAAEESPTGGTVDVTATRADGSTVAFKAVVRIDTPAEADYYRNNGILNYVLRRLAR